MLRIKKENSPTDEYLNCREELNQMREETPDERNRRECEEMLEEMKEKEKRLEEMRMEITKQKNKLDRSIEIANEMKKELSLIDDVNNLKEKCLFRNDLIPVEVAVEQLKSHNLKPFEVIVSELFKKSNNVTFKSTLQKEYKKHINEFKKQQPVKSIQIQHVNWNERSTFECEICCKNLPNENRYRNPICGHQGVCIDCVKDHVSKVINRGESSILCPIAGCPCKISEVELFTRFIDSDALLDKYIRNSISIYVANNRTKCKYCPKCHELLIFRETTQKGTCPRCKINFCTECLSIGCHEGMTCSEYRKRLERDNKNDELFREWIKQNGAVCPKCGLGCQRIRGSNWIYCHPCVGGCGSGFCYKCGKEADHYSPHILQANCSLSPKHPNKK